MFETIAGIIYQGLVAHNTKDSKKHLRELKSHLEDYYEELDKPSWEERANYPNHKKKHFRDNNVIDSAKRGVYIIGKAYSSVESGGKSLRDLIKS